MPTMPQTLHQMKAVFLEIVTRKTYFQMYIYIEYILLICIIVYIYRE